MPSTAAIRPPTTVKAISAAGRPRRVTSTPAAPLTMHRAEFRVRAGAAESGSGHGRSTVQHGRGAREAVGAQHDLRVKELNQRRHVPGPGGGEKRVDHRLLRGNGTLRLVRARRPDPVPRPARQLPGGFRRAVEHRGDLTEREVEHVVQHERDPFGRGQRVEDHEQREPHRVGEQRLLLGCRPVRRAEHRVGHA